ncbi:MAG: amino acid adenylation domain-containing protein [Candidatus Solibacter sp.]
MRVSRRLAAEETNSRPLSPMQRSMVLASLRGPRSGVYLLQDVCELAAEADLARLREAWRLTARRHQALRTRIEMSPRGEPHQAVEELPPDVWQELDWRGLRAEEAQAAMADLLQSDRARGFRFEDGVPMRFVLIRMPGERSTIVWTLHHALLDARSLATVWQEWLAAYEGRMPGEPAASPEPEDIFDEAGAERYWRGYLAGVSAAAGTLTDRLRGGPRDAAESPRAAFCFDEDETRAIHEFAGRQGVTAHTLLQGAWALLLSRYGGREDVVFGVTRAGRRRTDRRAGLFINTLPLRVKVDETARVSDWLRQMRAAWEAQREFHRTPLEFACNWGGWPAGTAPFDSVLVYEHISPEEFFPRLGGAWAGRKFRRLQRTDSTLTLVAYGVPLFHGEIVYDPQRFHPATVFAMVDHLRTMIRGFMEKPEGRLWDVAMIGEAERQWLLRTVNETETEFPSEACAHQLIERQAQRTPDATALEWPEGRMSYQELNRRANHGARALRESGVGPEDLIGVCLARSPEAVVAILAVLKAGAAFLPLRPDLPLERLAGMAADARPKLVIAAPEDRGKLESLGLGVLSLAAEPEGPAPDPPCAATPARTAYVIYTSGSTGRPKAVALAHRALVNHSVAAARVFGITEKDRRLQFASMGTDVFVAEVFNYLSRGATLVFCLDAAGNSLSEFLRLLESRAITITGVPATWWKEWVAALESGTGLPATLRAVIVGMERVNPEAFACWRRLTGAGVRWFNAYGPSETSPTATIYEAGCSSWEAAGLVPIGRPIANLRAYVLDGRGAPVPAGVVGELYLGGAGVGLGYLNRPEETAGRFLADPFGGQAGGRMYRTGDMVFRLPDGNLVFAGRVDRQVKIRGFRIELEEIEAVLEGHEAIRQCAAIVLGDEGRERLAAYFTPAGEAAPNQEALRTYLAQRLPEHMLPAALVPLTAMPLTPSGKIDRQALPAPDGSAARAAQGDEEPSTLTEQLLADLWREALDIERAGIGDSFFALGGDSLAATRLILLIEKYFGKEVPLAALVRAATPARMAAFLSGAGGMEETEGAFFKLQPRGGRLPFLCITTTAAGPLCYRELAENLGAEQPFFVLPQAAPDGDLGQNVRRLATEACAAIRASLPKGPRVLGGYCLGGIVAYETARRLAAMGEEVRLVVLFDAPAPGYPKLWRSWKNYWRYFRKAMSGEVKIKPWEILPHVGHWGRLLRRKATRVYRPGRASFPVIQFVAREEPITAVVLEDPRYGWRDLCDRGLKILEVHAHHGNLFHGEAAGQMAGLLREALLRANGEFPE